MAGAKMVEVEVAVKVAVKVVWLATAGQAVRVVAAAMMGENRGEKALQVAMASKVDAKVGVARRAMGQ